ncbi:MAG: PHP-associated domain-containing protein [Candidatus Woesearchaeota archaeon]
MTIYKLDLHTQPQINKNNIKNFLSKLFQKRGNLVLGIANWNNDGRYEKFLKAIKFLPKRYQVNLKNKDYFISITKNKKTIHIIKTDEIETNKGHILIVGYKGKVKKRRNLKELLKIAHKSGCIIIANHPLHGNNIAYFLILKLIGNKYKLSLDKKDIKKNKFDAVELNPYFQEDWKKIKKFAKKEKIKIVADSDAHFFDELFKSYFEVKDLNFKNPKTFKKSLKKDFKKHIKIHAQKHGFIAKYKHIIQSILENIKK